MSKLPEAIIALLEAVAIFQESSDRHDEGTVGNNLGLVLQEMRGIEEAAQAFVRSRELLQEE
ncbi:hypothetical protein ACQEU3_44690 [Spirillospora sp. CA-253888]